jgi:hypothetical protein
VVTALWMRPLMGLSYDTLALLLKPLAWAVGR